MLYESYLNKYFYFNFILKKNEINKLYVINSIIRMDNEYNYDNNDNNVRAPDNTKKEQLLQDNRSEYEQQEEDARYWSLLEFNEQKELNEKYEEDTINEHKRIIIERRELFRGFLFDLNKLIRFDKDIKEIYEIIEPIIDCYCAQYMNQCEIDTVTHDRIFKVIGNVRTDKNAMELLKKILIKSE
jgi:hypothetical protein